jgi:hypothetical protein
MKIRTITIKHYGIKHKNTYGYSAAQLANGTPSDSINFEIFFLKMTNASPTKDINGGTWD